MSIAQMKKVSLLGNKSDLKKVIDTIKQSGEFQITFYKNAGADISAEDTAARTKMTTQISNIKNILAFAKNAEQEYLRSSKLYEIKIEKDNRAIWDKITPMTYNEIKNTAKKETAVTGLLERLERQQTELNGLRSKITKNRETISAISKYYALPLSANLIKNTKYSFTLCGVMPETEFLRYKNDIDITNFVTESFPSKNGYVCVVVTGDIDELPVADAIYNYKFESFPSISFDKTPAKQMTFLSAENDNLEIQIYKTLKNSQIKPDEVQILKTYYDYLLNELDTFEILTATMQTKKCFIVNGWIPARNETIFTDIVKSACHDIIIKTTDAADTDNPPVLTHNSAIVAPFGSVTAMYGLPSQNDIDPNPFVAFFYFLFFGIMLGDAGYGILLSVMAGLILYFKKPKAGLKQMLSLFLLCGISATAWGVIFNSLFGVGIYAKTDVGFFANVLPSALLDPMGNATFFLAMTLYFGIVQILVGLLLNFYNLLRYRKYNDAFLGALPHFVLFFGLALAFPKMIGGLLGIDNGIIDFFAPLTSAGTIIALVGVAGIILFNGRHKKGTAGKVLGSLSGAYGLVNYFGDILSYARLFGVGLAGTVIGYVANYLANLMFGFGIIGIPFGIVIAIFFHCINLGLGLLSSYVHDARLQFIEFFGKFYEGAGKPFTPLGSNLRYTKIR
ncbi:MAG: V-type ATP synthase subunit I [Christensenellaceae bacterium]|jgi:V/A-type H+-transporting ATPase subunit I|nr:V-type ATP synthase subunit I [Christensenellaceae bacterium]